ncbi:MAG: Protein transport protein Sec24C, variant 2 [Marteilia pararefringens]
MDGLVFGDEQLLQSDKKHQRTTMTTSEINTPQNFHDLNPSQNYSQNNLQTASNLPYGMPNYVPAINTQNHFMSQNSPISNNLENPMQQMSNAQFQSGYINYGSQQWSQMPQSLPQNYAMQNQTMTNNSSMINSNTSPSNNFSQMNAPLKVPPKSMDSKNINQNLQGVKQSHPTSDYKKFQFIPNHADFENNYFKNKTDGPKIHVSGKGLYSAPYSFEQSKCIDQGLSIPKIAATSFLSWHNSYQIMNSKLPMILNLNPFPVLTEEESPLPAIDRRKGLSPIRCGRCRAYINSRCRMDVASSSFICPLCNESTIIPPNFVNQIDAQGALGHNIETSNGTYDLHVDGNFLEPSGNKYQPVFVFLIEISKLLIASGTFCNIFDSIIDFIINHSNLTDSIDIPFMIASYSEKNVNFVGYDRTRQKNYIYTIIGNQEAMEMNIDNLLLRRNTFPAEKITSILEEIKSKFCSMVHGTNNMIGGQFHRALNIITTLLNCNERNSRVSIFQNSPLVSSQSKLNGMLNVAKIPDAASKFGFNETTTKNAVQGALKSLNVHSLINSNPYDDLIRKCKDKQKAIIDLYMITDPKEMNCEKAEKLCYETSGSIHILFDLQDFSIITDRLIKSKTTVFSVNFVVRTSLNTKIGDIYGPFVQNTGQAYQLNGLMSNQSFCIEMKPESNSFPTHQKSVIIQPAILYTDMLGRRLSRIINLELPIVSSFSDLFIGANPDVFNAYFLKKVTHKLKTMKSTLNFAVEECAKECSDIFQIYLKNVVSYKDSQANLDNTLRMPLKLSILPSIVTAINFNFGTNKALCPNIDLFTEFSIINMNCSAREAGFLVYPMIYCFSDIMNQDMIIELPPRIRALKYCIDQSKIYFISNGFKILLSIGEKVPLELLSTLFVDPKMHKVFHMSCNLRKCINGSKQVIYIRLY